MKMVVLGGCADMAVPLLARLRDDDAFTEVRLADIHEKTAQQTAKRFGEKFKAAYCDACNSEQVVEVLTGFDIAACYIGPFYRFEEPLAACAIKAGVHYVSIADDYDAYLGVITLDDAARAANVKVLTGFGNSPGITQILAAKGYNALEHPERIHINWCGGADESVGPSNLMHLFHIFHGDTLQWVDGKEVRVRTGTGRKRVAFPEPIGNAWIYYTGHAESVSLPRNLPGLHEVTLHGGVKPHYIVTLLKIMRTLGAFDSHKRRAALARFFHRIESWFPSGGLDKSVGRVDVFGSAEAGETNVSYSYVGHIAEITSLPLYLAAQWLGTGKFNHQPGGVYAPERLLNDPDMVDEFIQGLQELGVDIRW